MRLRSMRVRMTAAFAASIAAVLLVVCGGVMFYAWRAAERNADTMLAAMGERVVPGGHLQYTPGIGV